MRNHTTTLATALAVAVLFGVAGASTHARADSRRPSAIRCPAPGETFDDARSTAPPRHTTEELAAIRAQLEPSLVRAESRGWVSIGDGRDTVEIGLAPGRERLASRLVERYGDAIRIHVGSVLFVPRGCGTPPPPRRCPDLDGTAPRTAEVALSVVVDTPRMAVDEGGRGRLEIHNLGTAPFVIDPGSVLVGSLVAPGTKHVVGEYPFPVAGTGKVISIRPGATGTVDVVFGAGRCDGRAGSALPPGRYGVRVVLAPEGPAGADLRPRLLSPETTVTVTR